MYLYILIVNVNVGKLTCIFKFLYQIYVIIFNDGYLVLINYCKYIKSLNMLIHII